jgi:phosphoribosylformylglycinamidine synthase I
VTRPPRIGVVVFPGSNDDRDTVWALSALGADPVPVWHAESRLPALGAVVLPGGFSSGDYLRAGALARFAPVMRAIQAFADEGGLVLGICNGFQILCEAGLLPGALRPNASLSFVCRDVSVQVARPDTPFTSLCAREQMLTMPVKHGEGCFFAPADLAVEQIVFRYGADENPNGADRGIAGVVNADGNVLGLMPHPEHAVDPLLGSADGAFVLGSLVGAAHERSLAAAA